jgi:uncharacterized coiled-coil protein SlyX
LRNHLAGYLNQIEEVVHELKGIYIERYEEELLGADRANLRIRIRFQNNELLELNEAVVDTKNKVKNLGYRYHFQDGNNQLIFRYDNTPHYPEIDSFPHHKHSKNKVVAVYQKPSIPDTIQEVLQWLEGMQI